MTQIIRNAVHLRRKVILYACNTDTHSVFTPVYIHLSHNRLYLREILYTIDIWTAVCVFEHWELIALCMRTEEVGVREREHFYQRDSAYPAFTNFKLIDKELWLPGKTGRLVTQSLTLRVLRLLFQIASSRLVAFLSAAAAILRLDMQTRGPLWSNDSDAHFERQDS